MISAVQQNLACKHRVPTSLYQSLRKMLGSSTNQFAAIPFPMICHMVWCTVPKAGACVTGFEPQLIG